MLNKNLNGTSSFILWTIELNCMIKLNSYTMIELTGSEGFLSHPPPCEFVPVEQFIVVCNPTSGHDHSGSTFFDHRVSLPAADFAVTGGRKFLSGWKMKRFRRRSNAQPPPPPPFSSLQPPSPPHEGRRANAVINRAGSFATYATSRYHFCLVRAPHEDLSTFSAARIAVRQPDRRRGFHGRCVFDPGTIGRKPVPVPNHARAHCFLSVPLRWWTHRVPRGPAHPLSH